MSTTTRGRRWLLAGILAVVCIVALAFAVIPDYLARRLLGAELARLGLTVEGLATLDVEVIDGEVSLGPVSIRHADAPAARLELADLDLRLGSLLADRIVLENVVVAGLDVHVTIGEAGLVLVNGIPFDVDDLAGAASPLELVRGFLGGRDLGVERVEARDSRVLLQGPEGGELEIEVERLGLTDLRGWEPERAARLELRGVANDVSVSADGELAPFAAEPFLVVDAAVGEISLERLERLLGRAPVSRREGVARFEGRHESRFRAGTLTGQAQGTLVLDGLDLAVEAGPSLAARRAEIALDARHEFRAEDDWRISGRVEHAIEDAVFEAPDRAVLTFRSLRGRLDEVEASARAGGTLALGWTNELAAEGGRFDGRIHISTDLLIVAVRLLEHLAASGVEPGHETGLELWAGRELTTPASHVEVSRLALRDRFSYEGGDGSFVLELDSEVNATGVQVVSEHQRTDIGGIALTLEDASLAGAESAVTLAGDLSLEASDAAGSRETGRATVDSVKARLDRGSLRSGGGTLAASAAGEARLVGLEGAALETADAPPASFGVGDVRVVVNEAQVDAAASAGQWTLRGHADAGSAFLDVGVGLKAIAKADRAELREVTVDEHLKVAIGTAALTGTELAATRSYLVSLLGGEGEDVGEPATRPDSDREHPAAPSGRALVERVQHALAALGYDPGPVDGLMGPKTVAAIERFQDAAGLPVDGTSSAELLAALESRAATSGRRAGRRPTVAIARLVADDGARVHFSDDTVTPDVDSHVDFETLSVAGLDTGNADGVAEIRAAAAVNEFSRLEIEGTATPLKRPPDVDLRLRLVGLQLSPYSPYVAELSGITVEEGVLSSEATGKVASGSVDATVKIDLHRLEVATLSEEDAQRAAETLGIDPETAVGLLKDAEGRIELTIPVSGTVEEPELDIGEAVSRAVTGVLAAVFPPNVIARMLKGGGDDLRFQPVVFEPGSTDFGTGAREYLDDLATLMAEHPEMVITLCGRAGASDARALAAMLTERLARPVAVSDVRVASHAGALAVDRARATRRHLTAERGVDPAMIAECRSSFDVDDDGEPRVEIAL